MPKCSVMLFAAGLGTRLRPYTNIYPKPAIPLMDIPLGYYLFPYLQKLSVDNFVVNTFHLPQKIHRLYKNIDSNIKFSDEVDFIKGSGGGLKQAENLFGLHPKTILVCNSDEVLFTKEDSFLNNALAKHQANQAFATLVVMKHPQAGTKFGAIWTDDHGRVIHIGKESPAVKAEAWHFIGLQFLSPKIFSMITLGVESNIFYDVLIHHLKNEVVQIYPIETDWYETGNVVDYSEAKHDIIKKLKLESQYKKQFEALNKLPKLTGPKIGDLA
ncbi:MAG: mannose-1-phosphate guanyltransferase [Bdellovibrionaceae bacterium]|nr:mannose-1-phosphate guanyltransferase [Pseudobdellovibrionaceae bacterium]